MQAPGQLPAGLSGLTTSTRFKHAGYVCKKTPLKTSPGGKQHSLYTAFHTFLVMIQAGTKQFVRRFPSVKRAILETPFPRYLMWARWGMLRRLSQCIREDLQCSDVELAELPLLHKVARGAVTLLWLAVAHNGPQVNPELQSKADLLYRDREQKISCRSYWRVPLCSSS